MTLKQSSTPEDIGTDSSVVYGYTIGIHLPPEMTFGDVDTVYDCIASFLSGACGQFDIHMAGQAGDPLGLVDGEARP